MPKSSSTPVLSLPVEVGLRVPGDYGCLWFVVRGYGQVQKTKKKNVKKELQTTQDEAGNVSFIDSWVIHMEFMEIDSLEF